MYLFELVGFFFAVKCPGVELLSHMVVLFSVLWEISVLFSIEAAPVYIATRIYEGSLFSISLPTFVICGLFDISCSDRFEEISHYGFSLHFSDDKWYKACFYVPIGHLYVFFGKMPIQVVCPFFIWGLFFCFFLKFTFLFIYWFIDWLIAVLGLRFCARAFSSCGKQGPLFIAVRRPLHYRGLSCCGAQAPDAQAQQLWLTGPVAPRHVGSSQTRARTHVPRISRQTLNHCATWETP